MNALESKSLEQTLKKEAVHKKWKDSYRAYDNERFFEKAFSYIVESLDAPRDSTFLDVGCGTCAHSIRLANRGFFVLGIDFSEIVLKWAEENIRDRGMKDRIRLKREDALSLTFKDAQFSYILCWGVLMHIHNIEQAISELSRVLKPGGTLVISEGNMNSLQSLVLRNLKRLLGKEKAFLKRSNAGIEYWTTTSTGKLLTREANIQWLISKFKNKGFLVKKHVAGQFTELYIKFSWQPIQNLIHAFNNMWFNHIKCPRLSFGNIIILQKEK